MRADIHLAVRGACRDRRTTGRRACRTRDRSARANRARRICRRRSRPCRFADRRAGSSRRDNPRGCGPGMIMLRGRNPGEAAIVADVHLAVGPERRAVRAARNLRDDLLAAVGIDPGQALAADFHQHHRAVRHHDRPFGKFEVGGENADVGTWGPSRLLVMACRRMSGTGPACASFASGYGKVVRLAKQAGWYASVAALSSSLRGTQISKPPLPVAGSNFSS